MVIGKGRCDVWCLHRGEFWFADIDHNRIGASLVATRRQASDQAGRPTNKGVVATNAALLLKVLRLRLTEAYFDLNLHTEIIVTETMFVLNVKMKRVQHKGDDDGDHHQRGDVEQNKEDARPLAPGDDHIGGHQHLPIVHHHQLKERNYKRKGVGKYL